MRVSMYQSTNIFACELAHHETVSYALRMEEPVLPENIRALRSHLGLNQEEFAERIGAKQFQISKWENKGDEPSTRPLAKMSELAGVHVLHFMDERWKPGEGPGATPATKAAKPAPANDDTVQIISLDLSLSMGPGTLIEDFVESEPVSMDLALVQSITRTPSDRLRLVKGIGDSMEPTLRTGDRVMVDINDRQFSRINGIYWIDHFGAHGIKRLRSAGKGRILVISDNPLVADFEVAADELRIEGRVIWFAREL
jgi:phage repressor protein C with HTH and peptisase S24 domain